MNELIMLSGAEPRKFLQVAIEQEVPAVMSYLHESRRHVAKVQLASLGANRMSVEVGCHFVKDGKAKAPTPCALNVQVDQRVSISLKHGYGRLVFEAPVIALENGGPRPVVVLAVPDWIKVAQRRSYLRVAVPEALRVNVQLWRRRANHSPVPATVDPDEQRIFWQGRLVEISAGGAHIALDIGQGPDLKEGQIVELAFIPLPYEVPLKVSAQIRDILPTADNRSTCVGMKFIGLEASPRGRRLMKRLCNVVERYYRIEQSSAKQQDLLQTTNGTDALRQAEPSSPVAQSQFLALQRCHAP